MAMSSMTTPRTTSTLAIRIFGADTSPVKLATAAGDEAAKFICHAPGIPDERDTVKIEDETGMKR